MTAVSTATAPAEQLWEAMAGARYSVFRLETFQIYNEPGERPAFTAFRAGRPWPDDPGNENPYRAELRSARARGCAFGRVHVVTEPLTEYVRFELAAYGPNVDAGDDVRILPVGPGRLCSSWPVDIPHGDFWLIDSSELYVMDYSADMTWVGLDRVHDPGRIVAACRTREAALHYAEPWRVYTATGPADTIR